MINILTLRDYEYHFISYLKDYLKKDEKFTGTEEFCCENLFVK